MGGLRGAPFRRLPGTWRQLPDGSYLACVGCAERKSDGLCAGTQRHEVEAASERNGKSNSHTRLMKSAARMSVCESIALHRMYDPKQHCCSPLLHSLASATLWWAQLLELEEVFNENDAQERTGALPTEKAHITGLLHAAGHPCVPVLCTGLKRNYNIYHLHMCWPPRRLSSVRDGLPERLR